MQADVFVQVHVEVLEDDHDMLAEVETILELDNALIAFIVRALILIHFVQLGEEFYFNVGVVNIKFFVLSNLGGDYPLVWISVVDALDNLPEGAFINYFSNQVTVAQLFTNFGIVKSIFVSYGVLIFSPDVANSVDT